MYAWQIIFYLFENSFHNLGDWKLQFHWEACHEIPSVVTKQLSYEFRQLLSFSYTGCPNRYWTWHFFNNSKTNEDIATEQTHTTDTFLFISHKMNVLLFKVRCNIFIGVRIIKEMPASVASGTLCTFKHNYFHVIMYLSAGSVSTNKKNMNALQTRKKIAVLFFLRFHSGSVRLHYHFCATSLCWGSTVNILEKSGVCICTVKWLIGNSPTQSGIISPQPPNSITLKTRNVNICKLSAK
jgi:hypothetical protein